MGKKEHWQRGMASSIRDISSASGGLGFLKRREMQLKRIKAQEEKIKKQKEAMIERRQSAIKRGEAVTGTDRKELKK